MFPSKSETFSVIFVEKSVESSHEVGKPKSISLLNNPN